MNITENKRKTNLYTPLKAVKIFTHSFGSNISSLQTAYAAAPAMPRPARITRL